MRNEAKGLGWAVFFLLVRYTHRLRGFVGDELNRNLQEQLSTLAALESEEIGIGTFTYRAVVLQSIYLLCSGRTGVKIYISNGTGSRGFGLLREVESWGWQR